MMEAIEISGHIDKSGSLQVEIPALLKEGKVKVIIMYTEESDLLEENVWLKTISNNPAFHFLKEEDEIYSLSDGKPLNNET